MADEHQPGLPGLSDEPFLQVESSTPRVRRTLRDLVAEQEAAERDLAGGADPVPELRLGFPSAAQLAKFVAGYHQHLLADLDLGKLEVVAGGTKPSRRYYHLGRSVTPDILLRTMDDVHVVVSVSGGATASTRMPLVDELMVVGGIMGPVIGVLVTPDGLDGPTASAIWAHIAELRKHHDVHWLRYTIGMRLELD